MAVAISAHEVLFMGEPGAIQKLMSGEMTMGPVISLLDSLFWLIPLVMAVLSVTLKDVTNRRVNLVMGGFFTIMNFIHLVSCPIVHLFEAPSVHQLLIVGSTIVVTVLIVWHAWKWPKQEV